MNFKKRRDILRLKQRYFFKVMGKGAISAAAISLPTLANAPAVSWNPEIKAALWTKLAINCAINPLTGLEQVKNGELADQKFGDTLSSIVEELTKVMQAEEIACSFDELEASIKQVIQATAQNNSSMKQDMFYQRKTEIDFITGHLIKRVFDLVSDKVWRVPKSTNV